MKNFICTLALLTTQKAFSVGYDGCYQLYNPGAMYPAFCIQGTIEEGIGGSNAYLTYFNTNTDIPLLCLKTSSLSFEVLENANQKLSIHVDGKIEMILEFQDAHGKSGKAQIGQSQFLFSQLDSDSTQRLKDNLNSTNLCK